MSNETATPERAARGKIVTTGREVTDGGIVEGQGDHDAWHCYIDFLYDMGLLGPEPAASQRKSDALRFRELYVRTHPSQKSNIRDASPAGQPGESPTNLAEIGDAADCLKSEWLLVMRYTKRHIRALETMCVQTDPPSAPISIDEIEAKVREEAKAFAAAESVYLSLLETRKEYGRQRARREMQEKLVEAHVIMFRVSALASFAALDALPEALQRARKEAWPDEE